MSEFSWNGFDPNHAGHQAFKGFLQLDVQNYPKQIEALMTAIEQVQQGQLKQWHGGGNAYFCEITIEGALLEITMDGIDDSKIPLVPLECCLAAATAWLQRCRSV